jgi:hypothetical protein
MRDACVLDASRFASSTDRSVWMPVRGVSGATLFMNVRIVGTSAIGFPSARTTIRHELPQKIPWAGQ